MKSLAVLLLLPFLVILGGCSGVREPVSSSYSEEGPRAGTVMSPMAPESATYKPAAVARERSGLGTSWGEARESQVGSTRFVRNHSSSPNGQGKLFYNDKPGVESMVATFGGGSRVSPPMQIPGGLISMWLRDSSSRWLPGLRAGGNGFVIGQRGERYEIYLKNESRARIEVVTSVDGLDVMDGKPASYRKRGYVLNPGEAVNIDGFRTGFDSVAAFRFGSVADSYSALKHGTTRNVGVIGAAVFVEKGANPWASEPWSRREADPFPGRRWATGP